MGAYASTVAPLRKFADGGGAGGLYPIPSSGAGISGGGSMFIYCSSNAATDITGTGFFTGCGAQPFSSTGTPHPNVVTRHSNNVGVRPGDLVLNLESSGGATPGRATWHGVTASTWGGSTSSSTGWPIGYDCTVAAHAST